MNAELWWGATVRGRHGVMVIAQFLFLIGASVAVFVSVGSAQDLAMTSNSLGSGLPDSSVSVDLTPVPLEMASLNNNATSEDAPISMSSPSIFTIAGTGDLGFKGDGSLATRASLWFAAGVTVDAEGNVFIADSFNNRIRKVSARTGMIVTFAGTGEPGFAGDGDLATEAKLNSPAGVAVDAKGNVLIADTFNNRIRIVDARTGIISTVTGTRIQGAAGDEGLAVRAQLSEPAGLVVDTAGNLLIADTSNHRIRRLEAGTGVITTVVGTGVPGFSGDDGLGTAAQLNGPSAVAVDAHGNVVIADTFNNRIRRVDASTGTITTVAGTGLQGFSGDGGLANHAQLTEPSGVAVDANGNILIADTFNNRVRHVDMNTGVITTIVGAGTRGLSVNGTVALVAELNNPMGLTRDMLGNIVVADAGNNRILRVIAEGR